MDDHELLGELDGRIAGGYTIANGVVVLAGSSDVGEQISAQTGVIKR